MVNETPLIRATPWDAHVFGIPTWELLEYSTAALEQASRTVGHHTVKVNPLADKRLLHEYGFYYCDTLIEPYCNLDRLRTTQHPDATLSKRVDAERLLAVCHGAFTHGRFHRDFNLSRAAADLRYENWLKQLLDEQQVYALNWQGELAGFIGYSGNNLVLHALSEDYRGKGLAKYWWSQVCRELLANGNETVKSSISATNLAVFKLYASLGFSFDNPQDIYHCMIV